MSHFFISRAGQDCEWAKWISNRLEEAGHSTVLQDFDFKPGDSIPHQMKLALEKSDHVIAVISPHYLGKEFTLTELYAAFAKVVRGNYLGKEFTLTELYAAFATDPI